MKRIRQLGRGLIFHKILKSPAAAAVAAVAAAVAGAAPQADPEPAPTMAREMGVRAQFPVRLVVLRLSSRTGNWDPTPISLHRWAPMAGSSPTGQTRIQAQPVQRFWGRSNRATKRQRATNAVMLGSDPNCVVTLPSIASGVKKQLGSDPNITGQQHLSDITIRAARGQVCVQYNKSKTIA